MNLAQLGEEQFQKYGDYESVFFEGKWISTGEGRARSRAVGVGLQELGVGSGDRVAVMLPNVPEVAITYWAAWRIGAAVTPIMFLLSPPEINRIITDSGAKVLITSPDFLLTISLALDGVNDPPTIVSVGGGDGVMDFTDLERNGEESEIVDRDPDDLAALLYTGGTTGSSKGVMLSHNNLAWTARAAAKQSEIKDGEIGLTALPISHSFGLHVSIVGALVQGKGILMRWFDPNGMLDLIEQHRVERMALVPTMLQMLLAMPLEERDLSSLQSITSGAAALPLEVLRTFEERVPNCKIIQGYGLTETSPTVSVQPPSSARDGSRKLGSVGKVVPGCEVRIVDEDGTDVPEGEPGEITVKGPNVMLGYWNNDEATAAAIKGGWFHTGDMGKLDSEGNLFIVERKKDLIIRGGFNVYPNDVEGVILQHSAVAEAAVVGKPSEKFGEEPIALVVFKPDQDATTDDVMEFAAQNLAKYKRPVEIRKVEEIPKTPVGKIDTKLIRAQLNG